MYLNVAGVDDIIAGSIGAVTQIASTVASIQDQNKRRQFEQNLALLDNKQRNDLEKQLQKTNNVNARIQILTNAVAQIRSAQSTALITSKVQAKTQSERTLAIVVLGGAVVLIGAVLLLKKK